MAIIGDEIRNYVAQQINVRQAIHGLGAGQALDNVRPDVVINVLNSNTSWVKLASGVSVASSKLTEIGVDTALDGLKLAKRYVLNAGFSKYEETKLGGRLTQREGFLPQETNSSYTYGTYGYSPMPGIISADIKALNRGSIKKATVKIKINNKEQFDIIDLLYFRLGYTVLLEWGNSLYFNNSVKKDNVRETIIDNESYFFNSTFGGSDSYVSILPKIENYRDKYAGNYDGLLGKISNFQWSFNKDGSYDAEITIISLGDVVESLKTNISTDRGLSQFIITSGGSSITSPSNPPTTATTAEEQPDILEDNKDANAIASMLWVWKWVNRDAIGQTIATGKIENILSGGSSPVVGSFLNPSGATISTTTTQYKFYYKVAQKNTSNYIDLASAFPEEAKNYPDIPPVTFTADELKEDPNSFTGVSFIDLDAISKKEQEFENALGSKKEIKKTKTEIFYGGNGTTSVQDIEVTYVVSVFSEKLANSTQNVSTDSPIKDFGNKDAFWLNSAPKFPLYLRLGALLEYLQNNVLPKIDTNQTNYASKPPIFKIDSNVFNNIMYSLPNQISLDPRVCIVKNKDFSSANSAGTVKEQFFRGLLNFRTSDSTGTNVHPNKAYMMNIYLNFNFILESLNSAADERGDTNTFSFLQNICNGINKALGGINNIEPVMDEETNTLRLQDTTPIPGDNTSPSYILQLYGYERLGGNQYISNFIRKIDLKTAITPEYATMITVGATAGGYVKGTEATAFSRWNEGLIDRFKEKFTPGNEVSKPDASGVDEAVTNYVEKMINISKYPATLGFLPTTETGGNGFGDESTDAIESNLSVGTEYFKYLISSQKNQQGGTVGFIPFKLGFTMDGLSGMKIYNKLHINTSFLPKAYGNTLDLIVTGVSHKLSNNDWETEIEATVIPKTTSVAETPITVGDIQETVVQVAQSAPSTTSPTITSCSGIPRSNGLNPQERRILKERNIDLLNYRNTPNTDEGVINFIRGKNEGGYFHPINYYSYDKPQVTHQDLGPGVSGETLWGEDRVAGGGRSTPKKREFWSIVDKYSGFGPLAETNFTHGKKSSIWKKKKAPDGKDFLVYKNRGWSKNTLKDINQLPNFKGRNVNIAQFKKDLKRLLQLKYEIPADSFYQQLDKNFSSYPQLKNLILSDVRTRYMWYRARYNGGKYFEDYAINLIKVWNSGERNLDKLICADLTYRYNYNKGKTYESDILRTVDYVIPNR
jgi:hypothetical protein